MKDSKYVKFAEFVIIRNLWVFERRTQLMSTIQSARRLKEEHCWLGTWQPVLIAGPCSAETEEQVIAVAKQLKDFGVDWFRAGVWKPRTRPGAFEGLGKKALPWLQRVQQQLGLKVAVEVAKAAHVEEALAHDIAMLWVGARTTANPFAVQEIADVLAKSPQKPPVLVKNPISPDLNLWIGAVERFEEAGIQQIGCIHRGFSYYGKSAYRNPPHWQIPIELKRLRPDLPLLCDPSHICGNRNLLGAVAQMAMDLNFEGIMIETHPTPDSAWSDASQQITPTQLKELLGKLHLRHSVGENVEVLETLLELREQIDNLDAELIEKIVARMQISKKIGAYKKEQNIVVLQPKRWETIVQRALKMGISQGLTQEFVENIMKAIHVESIRIQDKLMNE